MPAYTPKHLRLWTHPDHYAGATWEGYYSTGFGQSRDSDELEASNFATVLERLGGESKTVIVVRESHWAVGWVEWIAIPKRAHAKLKIADELRERYENYPVLDEEDFSRREDESAQTIWRDCYDDKARLEYVRQHRSQFDFHDYADLIGCVRGRYFAGNASEIIR